MTQCEVVQALWHHKDCFNVPRLLAICFDKLIVQVLSGLCMSVLVVWPKWHRRNFCVCACVCVFQTCTQRQLLCVSDVMALLFTKRVRHNSHDINITLRPVVWRIFRSCFSELSSCPQSLIFVYYFHSPNNKVAKSTKSFPVFKTVGCLGTLFSWLKVLELMYSAYHAEITPESFLSLQHYHEHTLCHYRICR